MCSLKFAKHKQGRISTKRDLALKRGRTGQTPFSPYVPYGRRKGMDAKRKPLRPGAKQGDKPIVWETTKHSTLRMKFLWKSRAGRPIDSL